MNFSDVDNSADVLLAVVLLLVAVAVWALLAWLAAGLAPSDRQMTFFWLGLFMGPVAIPLAIVASPRDPAYFAPPPRPVVPDRRRFVCPRCGADNDIPQTTPGTRTRVGGAARKGELEPQRRPASCAALTAEADRTKRRTVRRKSRMQPSRRQNLGQKLSGPGRMNCADKPVS